MPLVEDAGRRVAVVPAGVDDGERDPRAADSRAHDLREAADTGADASRDEVSTASASVSGRIPTSTPGMTPRDR